MTQQYISSIAPPLVWSTIDDAFIKINNNFTELFLTIGGTSVNLEKLGSSVSPTLSNTFSLGSNDFRWNTMYLGAAGLHIGDAIITSSNSTVDLPAGSTVNGLLIQNPENGSFKTISISGQSPITSTTFDKTLTLLGDNIILTTDVDTSTITISNPGVTNISASNGIAVSASTGTVNISNTGLISATAGTGITASTVNGVVTISNSGVTTIEAGTGMSVSASTGTVTITNISPNVFQNIFKTIAVSGQTSLNPPSAAGVLTFVAGSGIVLTTSDLNNSVTIASTSISKSTLQALVADSSSFSDFQLKIAML